MIEAANAAKKAISKQNVELKIFLTVKDLKEKFDNLRGAVMIAYPGYHGLPPWEPAVLILENKFDWEGLETDIGDWLVDKNTAMWWAGKELSKQKLLKDYTGKNEKTKIIAKLAKEGSGAPVREPLVDSQAQKNMIQYYHKKQEEFKKLEEDNDDHHLDSEWANSNNLKNSL